jgi:DNA polymerase-3 subunit epsilon
VRNSGAYRRAEQYRRLGGTIRVVSEVELDLPALAAGFASA